jgi:membrane associated rhomboid family serine protease
MVAQAPDGRTGRLAGAAGIALVLVGLTLLLEPASWRPAAAVLLALGLAVGTVVAIRRPPSGRLRTPMERLNDAAFLVVVAIVALIAVRLARPWTAALPGLVGGALLGLTLRPRLAHGRSPGHGDPAPGTASSDPGRTDPAPGRAGTPAPGTEPPGGGE